MFGFAPRVQPNIAIPDEKFAKQWSKESEDDIMIYDEWKDTQELEGRGWDIIKTEFIFMDGLKLDPYI